MCAFEDTIKKFERQNCWTKKKYTKCFLLLEMFNTQHRTCVWSDVWVFSTTTNP